MPIVTTYLLTLLQTHLERSRIVVWFDPEKAYTTVADQLTADPLPGVNFARYEKDQGFFALRRQLEPLWSQDELPRLLIYVPLAAKESHDALLEYIKPGVHLEADIFPPECNTRLAVIARQALEPIMPAAAVEKIIAQVESGQLTLGEVEALAEQGQEALQGALTLLFKTGNPEEIALRFLTEPALDHDLTVKAAGPSLAALLAETLAVDLGEGDDLAALRAGLARHLLVCDFLTSLAGGVPPALQTIPLPASPVARQAAIHIAQTWRLRRDLAQSYLQAAQKIEPELGLGGQSWSITTLQGSETFLHTEMALQTLVENALASAATPAISPLVALAQARSNSFWASVQPSTHLRWQVIAEAAQVLLQAAEIQRTLKSTAAASALSASALFKRYTGSSPSDPAWCDLDTTHRLLERDLHLFDLDPQAHDSLLKLVIAAQHSYAEAAHLLARRFILAYEKAAFTLEGITQQVEIYHDFIEPTAASVAYLLVDAFRFEMARTLCGQLPEGWQVSLTPALATPPTITEIGMAALLPLAETGLTIVPAGSGKLGVTILGKTFKNRSDRVAHLQEKGLQPVAVTELNQIAPLKEKKLRDNLKAARLIVVTATDEIDGLWEKQPSMARQLQDHVFDQLRRGLKTLFGLGVAQVVITADHGYLAGENLLINEPLDAPGGDTADLHRRAWVGKGGALTPECLRKPLSAFGIGGDLEFVTPYGLTCFKAPGGSTEYFHSGLSLQELVIPVLRVTPGKAVAPSGAPAFRLEVALGSKQISTRFFSVTIKGQAADLFAMTEPPRLRAELRAAGQIISMPVAATYGFSEVTRDVAMQFAADSQTVLADNTITLAITDIPKADTAHLFILDDLGVAACEVPNIPISIAL